VGIELVRSRKAKKPYPPGAKIGQNVTLAARKRGAIIRPLSDVIVLMPPPAIDAGTLKRLCGRDLRFHKRSDRRPKRGHAGRP
jgi:adenosylmethionine-8-amino-7-oxononanoate aminotransferase